MKNIKLNVNLWNLPSRAMGVIIPGESGVIFSTRTNGVRCDHPEIEGIYLPLPVNNIDFDYFFETKDNCNTILISKHLEQIFKKFPFKFLNHSSLCKCNLSKNDYCFNSHECDTQEAWQWIRVIKDYIVDDKLLLKKGLEVVLVYENSD